MSSLNVVISASANEGRPLGSLSSGAVFFRTPCSAHAHGDIGKTFNLDVASCPTKTMKTHLE